MRHFHIRGILPVAALLVTFAASSALAGDDAYFDLPIDQLTLTEGALPAHPDNASTPDDQLHPYVVLDGPGDGYAIWHDTDAWMTGSVDGHIFIHTPDHREVTGRLYLNNPDRTAMVQVKFKIPASQANPAAAETFFAARENAYQRLLHQSPVGSPWFGYQARLARQAQQTPRKNGDDFLPQFNQRADPIDDTFSLWSGDRAMAENLQLDKALPPAATMPVENNVNVDSIKGITVSSIDWKNLIKNKTPALDPLAAAIPADQQAIFLSSFDALGALASESLMALSDQAYQDRGLAVELARTRSQDSAAPSRYERQLGVPLKGLGQLLGPQLVSSVAITGCDPYFRDGTDVAILFATSNVPTLLKLLSTQLAVTGQVTAGAEQSKGKIGSLSYTAVRSPDRVLCSYVAALNGAVVLTNSPAELARLAAVQDGKADPLSKAPEYVFFRDRYALGSQNETGLLVISDAAIRRLCGPRWRIGDSRRARADALMLDLNAQNLDALVSAKMEPGPIHETAFTVPGLDDLRMTATGVVSDAYGSPAFLTPICEMKFDSVSPGEAQAYARWRDSYERNWRGVFDPIALQFRLSPKKVSADLTVMPLILNSSYLPMEHFMTGAKIVSAAGDPHDFLFRAAMSININSVQARMASVLAAQFAPDLKVDPLSWVGQSIWYYADDDPFWAEAAASPQIDKYFQDHLDHIPVALRVDVSDGFKLAAFLVAAHAFIDQSAPGMVVWENLSYKDQPYVKVSPSDQAKGQNNEWETLAIYYWATGNGLVLTPNQSMLQHAIDRQLDRDAAKKAGKTIPSTAPSILGDNLVLQVNPGAYDLFNHLEGREFQKLMQSQSWNNIPILNELKHRYPGQDPVQIDERFFHEKISDPAAGQYVWNDQWQTMESTVYGCPQQPKNGPSGAMSLTNITGANFGITFEHDGLRAKTEVDRQ